MKVHTLEHVHDAVLLGKIQNIDPSLCLEITRVFCQLINELTVIDLNELHDGCLYEYKQRLYDRRYMQMCAHINTNLLR